MLTIETDTRLCVPPEIQKCPYCGGNLWCSFESWNECDDGSWQGGDIVLNCDIVPELNDDDETTFEAFDNWLAQHTYMPYVYWLPAQVCVREWVNKHYRFNVMGGE